MYITMHLQDKPFQKIKSGQKTIEMRLFDGKRRFLTRGDTIEFIGANDERLICEVLGVHIYENFAELYKNFSKEELGYDSNEVADQKDMELYYPLEKQKQNCVIGIEIKVKK